MKNNKTYKLYQKPSFWAKKVEENYLQGNEWAFVHYIEYKRVGGKKSWDKLVNTFKHKAYENTIIFMDSLKKLDRYKDL